MRLKYDAESFRTIKHINVKATRLPIPDRDAALYHAIVSHPDAAARALRLVIDTDRDVEQFGALYLDSSNRPIGAALIGLGGRSQCPVDICELFRPAVIIGAVALIAGHNHPSGGLEPSADDLKLTARIVAAGKLLGVTVLDHLVITATEHASIRMNPDSPFSDPTV